MKITLIFPLWTEEYGTISHFAKKVGKLPPLNLCILASYAENKGHEVMIIDGEAEGLSIEETVKRTKEFNPDLIGITATTPFYHISVELAHALKKELKVPIAIGGPHITVLKDKVFFDCFDYAFIGESDRSWQEFLDKFEKKEDISSIKGMMFRKDNQIIDTGQHITIEDVNKIPVPARHLLKNELYNIGTMEGVKRFTTIATMRGCPYKCIFCSTKVFGKDLRKKDPQLVIKEMKECIEKFGIQHFIFLDETLTLDRNHIMNICDLIIKEKLNITFEGGTRANMVDEELIKKLKEAGLIKIGFGLEAVDESIRTTMKKMVPLESYIEANKLTNKYGIDTLNTCMIGLPGETIETIKKTLAFLRKSKDIQQANISIAVPYPGTELYDMAKEGKLGLKLETEDFSKYRRYNAAVMTVGEFSPEDLIEIQNEAYASIYLPSWRWESMIKRSGAMGALLTFKRLVKSLKNGKTRFLTNEQLGVKEE
jgi:anaerobic magnesium-protoporphyrin IX monomethyl ester cyclase